MDNALRYDGGVT